MDEVLSTSESNADESTSSSSPLTPRTGIGQSETNNHSEGLAVHWQVVIGVVTAAIVALIIFLMYMACRPENRDRLHDDSVGSISSVASVDSHAQEAINAVENNEKKAEGKESTEQANK